LGLGTVRRRQGAYAEAQRWLETARAAYAAAGAAPGAAAGEGRALLELGRLYEVQGAYPQAQAMLATGAACAAAAGDQQGRATIFNIQSLLASRQGDYGTARELLNAN